MVVESMLVNTPTITLQAYSVDAWYTAFPLSAREIDSFVLRFDLSMTVTLFLQVQVRCLTALLAHH
jgi:hypothetical protein